VAARLPKKITLARSVFATVNERDKKHQPHDEQKNLKRCEIKQLPNCWSGKPFRVSRFSQLFLLFSFSFFSGIPICLWKCVGPCFSPAREESQSRLMCPERFSRFLLSSLSVFLSWSRHHPHVHERATLSSSSCLLCSAQDTFLKGSDSTPIRRRRLPEANCGIIRRIPFG